MVQRSPVKALAVLDVDAAVRAERMYATPEGTFSAGLERHQVTLVQIFAVLVGVELVHDDSASH